MSTLLTLPELKAEIARLGALIGATEAHLPACGPRANPNPAKPDRSYLDADDAGYHVVEIYQGGETERSTTTDLDGFLYRIFDTVTFTLASEYEFEVRKSSRDPRRIMFPRQVELMAKISSQWAERKAEEHKQLLKRFPFEDRGWPSINKAEFERLQAQRAAEVAAEAARRAVRQERPFTAEEEADIRVSVTRGYDDLKLKPDAATPQQTQEAIRDAIDAIHQRKKKASKKLIRELGVNLGSLWGQTICDTLGWHWCMVTADGADSYAIASANGSHFIEPMNFIFGQLTSPASGDNTSWLLFNMLQAGKLPPAEAGAYQRLG